MDYLFLNIEDKLENIKKEQARIKKEAAFLHRMKIYNHLLDMGLEDHTFKFELRGGYGTNIFSVEEIKITTPDKKELNSEEINKKLKKLFDNGQYGERSDPHEWKKMLALSGVYDKTTNDNFSFQFTNNKSGKLKFLKGIMGADWVEFNAYYLQGKMEEELKPKKEPTHKTKKI